MVGGTAGWFLSGALGIDPAGRGGVAAAGAVLAPIALMLTPMRGGVGVLALRYGLSLAVLGMLLLSFTGPGRERPLEELLGVGLLLFLVGAAGHGILVATQRNATRGEAPPEP